MACLASLDAAPKFTIFHLMFLVNKHQTFCLILLHTYIIYNYVKLLTLLSTHTTITYPTLFFLILPKNLCPSLANHTSLFYLLTLSYAPLCHSHILPYHSSIYKLNSPYQPIIQNHKLYIFSYLHLQSNSSLRICLPLSHAFYTHHCLQHFYIIYLLMLLFFICKLYSFILKYKILNFIELLLSGVHL